MIPVGRIPWPQTLSRGGRAFMLCGDRENMIEARGATQAEAWWRAVEQAEAVGMGG